jgi:putative alpha-1,2-mannosidase
VHRVAAGHAQYANYSGWDIYRSEVPLLATIDPEIAADMATSLVSDAAQMGALPKWPVANGESGVMNGDAADPILADTYAFGARGFDSGAALA